MEQETIPQLARERGQSRPPDWFLICLLGILSVITPFAVDMYLPAFSHVAADFGTTTATVSLSLSTYFIGFALGQVLYGPLLDRFGRKPPLYAGLSAYIVASLMCAHPGSMRMLIVLRFIQAVGGCVAQVASVAMVRDFFRVEDTAKIFSLIFLIIGVSPLLAPSIGSLVMIWFGWHGIFILLAGLAAVTLALIYFLMPESHQSDPSVSLRPQPIMANFWLILSTPQFYTFALAGAFSFAGLFAYVAGSPIIFMDGYGVNAKIFGAIFAALTMGFIAGNQVNVYLLRKFRSQQIFFFFLCLQVLTGFIFFCGNRLGLLGLRPTLVLFFVFLSCIGLTYPNAAAVALTPFSRNAGSASALLGFIQMGTGAVISTGIGFFGAQAVITLLFGTACVALLMFLIGKRRIDQEVFAEASEATPFVH